MANENKLQDVIASSLQNIKNLIDTNTVIGTPIVAAGTTIIPISKVSMAYATGGLDYAGKSDPNKDPKNFGAGGGTGLTMQPLGFLIVDKDGNAVVFADLGEDEKREFAEFWEQSTVSELADKRLPLWTRRFVPPPALETRWSVRSPSPQGTKVHLRKKRKNAVQTSPAQSARART